MAAQARPFGIEVVDVRLRRADLPEENSQAIYARMQSEREQQARQYRGEGAEAAQTVRANADRERTIILADAQRDAQRVRGDGDAQATRTYGDAFGQDKQFFAFYRSLQAYRDALNGKDTAFVLSPEGNFFRFFGGVPGAIATAGAERRAAERERAAGAGLSGTGTGGAGIARRAPRPAGRSGGRSAGSRRFGAERRSPRCAPDTVTLARHDGAVTAGTAPDRGFQRGG